MPRRWADGIFTLMSQRGWKKRFPSATILLSLFQAALTQILSLEYLLADADNDVCYDLKVGRWNSQLGDSEVGRKMQQFSISSVEYLLADV